MTTTRLSLSHGHARGEDTHPQGRSSTARLGTDQEEELLTVREVARRLRVDDTTVRRWIKNGSLEAITLPHRGKRMAYRVKQATMDALLAGPLPTAFQEEEGRP